MIKTLNNTIKQDRTVYKIPRSVQDVIPIQRIFADGIFQFGTKYSRTLRFSDINYAIASKEDKTAMFLGYSELLNALDSGSTTKLTICNKQVNRQAFEDTVLLPQRGDSLDGFVNEFNGMLEGKISGSSASVEQERFITVSVHKKNVDEARTFFSRVTGEVSSKLSRLNSSSNELDAAERLDVLRGFFRPDESSLPFDLQTAMKRGHNLKDTICPDSLEFHRDYFKMGSQYGRVLFLKDYASYIKDSMILELTDLNQRMMLSIDMIPVPTERVAAMACTFSPVRCRFAVFKLLHSRAAVFLGDHGLEGGAELVGGIGGAKSAAHHHIQYRLKRRFRIAPDIRFIALKIDVFRFEIILQSGAKACPNSTVWEAITISISAKLIPGGVAANDQHIVQRPYVVQRAFSRRAAQIIHQDDDRHVVFLQDPAETSVYKRSVSAIRRACIGSLAKRADSSGKTALFLNPTAGKCRGPLSGRTIPSAAVCSQIVDHKLRLPRLRSGSKVIREIPFFALKAPYGDVINPVFLQCVEVQPGLGITKRCIFDPADRLRLTFRAAGKTYRAVCFFCGRAEQHRRVAERAVRCQRREHPHTRV